MPKYHFMVDWGGTRTAFSEVTGLDITVEVIEYREGNDPQEHLRKMPGLRKFNNITLKRGIVKNDNDFINWLNTQKLNTVEKRDIVISLLDETHAPIKTWKVRSAFPVKYSGPELHASANEVAIESLEIAHEGLEVE
jgi:phage tail-like protein